MRKTEFDKRIKKKNEIGKTIFENKIREMKWKNEIRKPKFGKKTIFRNLPHRTNFCSTPFIFRFFN